MGVFYDRNWSILSVRKITRKQHGNYLKINEISKIAVHEFKNFLVSWTILCTLQVSTFYCYWYNLKIRTRNWRLMDTLFKSFTELERVRQFTINYITNGTRWRLSLDNLSGTDGSLTVRDKNQSGECQFPGPRFRIFVRLSTLACTFNNKIGNSNYSRDIELDKAYKRSGNVDKMLCSNH